MERLTRESEDGRIAVTTDNESCLVKLWQYENTGYEPEEIPPRKHRFNLAAAYEVTLTESGESPKEHTKELMYSIQSVIEQEYQIGYADGVKSCKPENGDM